MFVGIALRRPLLLHAAVLSLALFGLTMLVDVDRALFDADEGALLTQVELLSDGHGWFGTYPAADIDPHGRFNPIANSLYREGEISPFPVRPALVALTTWSWQLGGVLGATLPGILGVVLAAAVAADLAGRIEPRSRLVAFWLAGIGSPLAFYALALRGHGPTAGLVAAALWCAVRAMDRLERSRWYLIAGATLASGAAAMLRREAVYFALAVLIASVATSGRARLLRTAVPAAAMLVGATVGTLIDQAVSSYLFDTGLRGASTAGSGTFWENRLSSTLRLAMPGYPDDPAMGRTLAIVAVVLVIVAAVRYRSRRDPTELVIGFAIGAALISLRLVLANRYMIPGLVPAFPLGISAFILGSRRRGGSLLSLLTVATVVLVALVGLTQYAAGGGFEWGSRYAALGLVSGIPVATVGLVRVWDALPRAGAFRPAFAWAALALALSPAFAGLAAQRHARVTNEANHLAGYERADELDASLIVSTHPEVPRTATDHFTNDVEWLWAWPQELPLLLPLLEQAEVSEAPMFTRQPELVLETLEGTGWEYRDVEIRDDNPGSVALGTLIRRDSSRGTG